MTIRFLLLSLSVFHLFELFNSVPVNIHVKLDSYSESMSEYFDRHLHLYCQHDDVWLRGINQPHITLYLTDFLPVYLDQLTSIVRSLSTVSHRCPLPLNTAFVSGAYGMWSVDSSPCLQSMSDAIVNATHGLITPNQPIPDWVAQLPDSPQKAHKIDLVQKFGSPNVFDQFSPHVTLAYDSYDSDNLSGVLSRLNVRPLLGESVELALGKVGLYGTVLRGKDFDSFFLEPDQTL